MHWEPGGEATVTKHGRALAVLGRWPDGTAGELSTQCPPQMHVVALAAFRIGKVLTYLAQVKFPLSPSRQVGVLLAGGSRAPRTLFPAPALGTHTLRLKPCSPRRCRDRGVPRQAVPSRPSPFLNLASWELVTVSALEKKSRGIKQSKVSQLLGGEGGGEPGSPKAKAKAPPLEGSLASGGRGLCWPNGAGLAELPFLSPSHWRTSLCGLCLS